MRSIRVGVLTIIVLLTSCGLIEPEDCNVLVFGTFVGVIPEEVEGIRLVADFPNGLYDRRDISEALIWADTSFRADHHARGDSTTIKTTFTLRPNDYYIRLQTIHPPYKQGGDWQYGFMGFDSRMGVSLVAGRDIIVRLRGTFD